MPSGGGRAPESVMVDFQGFPMKIEFFRDRIMGVETPIPPNMIYAAAPDGAPPRRIND
jgi:hypothetical protein